MSDIALSITACLMLWYSVAASVEMLRQREGLLAAERRIAELEAERRIAELEAERVQYAELAEPESLNLVAAAAARHFIQSVSSEPARPVGGGH